MRLRSQPPSLAPLLQVSAYEADLKDATDYGYAPPAAPEEPDFSDLEDQHALSRLNLERLSARRLSCVLLVENLLQLLRICSLVIPSRALEDPAHSAGLASPSSKSRSASVLAADDAHAHLDVLNDIPPEDEHKLLWLQLTLWLEGAVANLDNAVI